MGEAGQCAGCASRAHAAISPPYRGGNVGSMIIDTIRRSCITHLAIMTCVQHLCYDMMQLTCRSLAPPRCTSHAHQGNTRLTPIALDDAMASPVVLTLALLGLVAVLGLRPFSTAASPPQPPVPSWPQQFFVKLVIRVYVYGHEWNSSGVMYYDWPTKVS